MAEDVGEDGDELDEREEMFDEMLSPFEHDPSKAELMCICSKLNQLLISLKYKKIELAKAEGDYEKIKL